MKIAVTYENGEVFQHFGHTEQFKLYEVSGGKLLQTQVVDTNGSGHGALAGLLAQLGVDTLICGGIGGGAQAALAEANIRLIGGVQGNADEAVQAFLNGTLAFDPNVHCTHHDHGEGHSCGSHGLRRSLSRIIHAETEKVPQNLRSADVQRVFPAGKYDRVRANDAG